MPVEVSQSFDAQTGDILRITPVTGSVRRRPSELRIAMVVAPEKPVAFTLKVRMPWWLRGPARLFESGAEVPLEHDDRGFAGGTGPGPGRS